MRIMHLVKGSEKKSETKAKTKRTNLFIQESTDGMPPAKIQVIVLHVPFQHPPHHT